MSATVIAYTILGSKIDRDKLFIPAERSVHEACPDLGPGRYCSSCGKSVHEVVVTAGPVEGFEPEEGAECQGRIGKLDVLPVSWGDEASHFLAAHWSKVPGYGNGDPERLITTAPTYEEAHDWLRGVLEPLGLWEPESFGIWTALYYS